MVGVLVWPSRFAAVLSIGFSFLILIPSVGGSQEESPEACDIDKNTPPLLLSETQATQTIRYTYRVTWNVSTHAYFLPPLDEFNLGPGI